MIKAIIFDADGTLYGINTYRAYKATADFLESCNGINADKILLEWKNTISKINLSGLDSTNPLKRSRQYALMRTFEELKFNSENINQFVAESLDIFWKVAIEDLESSQFCLSSIKELKERYTLVVASEEFYENLILKLNHIFGDWEKYFKFLITPEVTGTMKPSEKYYIKAMEKLELSSSEILVIGDSHRRDIAPAEKLGMKTLLFNFNEMDGLLEKIKKIA